MCSGFDDASVVNDDDLVGIHDGGESVCDNDGGASFLERPEGTQDFLFSAGVEGGGCLIEEDNL